MNHDQDLGQVQEHANLNHLYSPLALEGPGL